MEEECGGAERMCLNRTGPGACRLLHTARHARAPASTGNGPVHFVRRKTVAQCRVRVHTVRSPSTVSRSIRRRRLAYASSHTPVPTHTDRGPRTRRPKRLAFARRAAARPARLRHWLFGFVLRRPPPYRYIGAAAGPRKMAGRGPVRSRRGAPAGLDSRLTSGLRRVPFRVRGYIYTCVRRGVARLRPVTSRHSPHAARKGELYEGDCIQSGAGVPLPDNAAARCEDRTRCTGAQLRYRRDTRNDLLISFPDSTRLNDY